MVNFYKVIIPICRLFNVVVLLLGLCLYGVAASMYSNVGSLLISLTIADIFCGTLFSVTAVTQCLTLKRRSTTAFKVSKSVGFLNTLIWFAIASAHYVTRNFKIEEAKRRLEFQHLMNVTLYGCLFACVPQLFAWITANFVTWSGGYEDDLKPQYSVEEANVPTPKEEV